MNWYLFGDIIASIWGSVLILIGIRSLLVFIDDPGEHIFLNVGLVSLFLSVPSWAWLAARFL